MEKLYTFVADYAGGTYLYQCKAKKLAIARIEWANNLSFTKLNIREKKKLFDGLSDASIVPIDDLSNVWCFCICIKKDLAIVHCIQTCGDN